MLAFTGSTEVGKHVGKRAVENLAFPALELEGNNVQIALDDADVEQAAKAGYWGSYLHAGQICTAINRHVVHEAVVDEYVAELIEQTHSLSVAQGRDPSRRGRATRQRGTANPSPRVRHYLHRRRGQPSNAAASTTASSTNRLS